MHQRLHRPGRRHVRMGRKHNTGRRRSVRSWPSSPWPTEACLFTSPLRPPLPTSSAASSRRLNARRPSRVHRVHAVPGGARPRGRLGPDRSAKLALEGRAFPFLTYDPEGGPDIADCLSLDGNPGIVDDVWPTYTLDYVDDDGNEAVDHGAPAHERRLGRHRGEVPEELLSRSSSGGVGRRHGAVPRVHDSSRHEDRTSGRRPSSGRSTRTSTLKRHADLRGRWCSLAEDRLMFWHQLK